VKFLALLLSVVVLTLTTVPCCPFEENATHVHETSSEEKHDKCPEKNDDCCKSCSPFYVCGSCIGFTINNIPALTFVIHLKPIQHNYIYIPVELRQMSSSIWQPPKLG
jgi:hypothetical protein